MRDSKKDFHYSLGSGFSTAALFGGVMAAVVGGVVALFGGPVVGAAAVTAGIFGLLGGGISALDAATSGRGDYRASWISAIPTTALMVAGILAYGSNGPSNDTKPLPSPTALTQKFNTASAELTTAGCVPEGSYPRTMIASKGPMVPNK